MSESEKRSQPTLAEALASKAPKQSSALAEALTGTNRNSDDDFKPKQQELFPHIDNHLFPMSISKFILKVRSITIEYIKDNKAVLTRSIYRISSDCICIQWASGIKNGSISIENSCQIQYRHYKNHNQQLTIFGSGGPIWISTSPITFLMEDNTRMDFEQWLTWREAQQVG